MPELAEVEAVRRQIETRMRGLRIKQVIADESDRHLFAFASVQEVKEALEGARVTGAGGKGKYFWIELDRRPWPIFHLGMSGNVAILDPRAGRGNREDVNSWDGLTLWSNKSQSFSRRLKFCRLRLVIAGGFEFAFLDPRRFGRMWLAEDPREHPRIKALGFDPLIDFPPAKELAPKLARRKTPIKSVLLDQALFAGVGNWLADEILYQSRISPHHLASQLSSKQVTELRKQTLAVVRRAAAVNADSERFPPGWLFHQRWGKSKTASTAHGKIIHETIGGRTTAWVPDWQK